MKNFKEFIEQQRKLEKIYKPLIEQQRKFEETYKPLIDNLKKQQQHYKLLSKRNDFKPLDLSPLPNFILDKVELISKIIKDNNKMYIEAIDHLFKMINNLTNEISKKVPWYIQIKWIVISSSLGSIIGYIIGTIIKG